MSSEQVGKRKAPTDDETASTSTKKARPSAESEEKRVLDLLHADAEQNFERLRMLQIYIEFKLAPYIKRVDQL